MKWGIIVKPNDEKARKIAKELHEFLSKKKENIYFEKRSAEELDIKESFTLKELNESVDIAVTVGGDGTILFALREIEKPVFAINSSAVGFLTEADGKTAKSGLEQILKGEYNIVERAKLKVVMDGKRLPDAANEITLQTANIAKMIEFDVLVDEEIIESMEADGIIIATPTGATGYALSVGGPIVDPEIQGAVIAPIAPFKLSARPWIVPYRKKICVELTKDSKEAKLVIDGRDYISVSPGKKVCVTASEKKARFVRFGESFYQAVRLKLVR
ncbi:MAG: NAD(+)/NADH kinase [Thermoplasmata archaeon]|nr:NAD(+)/NADH kinase [Thermoplasmata archaeon]